MQAPTHPPLPPADLLPERLTRHGEDPHQQVDAAVCHQRHLHRAGAALSLLPPGLEVSPDAGSEDEQVEDHHHDHPWDIDGHGGGRRLGGWRLELLRLSPHWHTVCTLGP